MKTRFKVLKGLPAYGLPAIFFSPTGHGAHQEGLVVEFENEKGERWTGNFQRGVSSVDKVFLHPNGQDLVVVSGGQGYLVNCNKPDQKRCFGGDIQEIIQLPEMQAVIFGNGLWFECLALSGLLWKSKRISWDGMRNLKVQELKLTGESWDISEMWIPFEMDIVTGQVKGGSYNGPG